MDELKAKVSALIKRVESSFPSLHSEKECSTETKATIPGERTKLRAGETEEILLSLPFVSQVCIVPLQGKSGMRAVVYLNDGYNTKESLKTLSKKVEKLNESLDAGNKISIVTISEHALPIGSDGRIRKRQVYSMFREGK